MREQIVDLFIEFFQVNHLCMEIMELVDECILTDFIIEQFANNYTREHLAKEIKDYPNAEDIINRIYGEQTVNNVLEYLRGTEDPDDCEVLLDDYEDKFTSHINELFMEGYKTNAVDNGIVNRQFVRDIIEGYDVDETLEFLKNYLEWHPEEVAELNEGVGELRNG